MASHPAADTQYLPDADVSCTRLDASEGVLLHLGTQQYYSLNETGLLIWERVHEGQTIGDIAEALHDAYDLSREEALDHVVRFLEELRRSRLVRIKE